MKQRVSAIIIKETKILLMYRFKPEAGEYYVLPGGTVEEDETLIDALKREVKEETDLDVIEFEKMTEFENDVEPPQLYHIYKITKFEGDPKIVGEELDKNNEQNRYELQWKELRELHELPLKPETLLDEIF